METHIKELRNYIKKEIDLKIKEGDTPAISFSDKRYEYDEYGNIGHIQYSTIGRPSWDVFYNGKCVYTSYTLISAVRKLDRLHIFQKHFLNDFTYGYETN